MRSFKWPDRAYRLEDDGGASVSFKFHQFQKWSGCLGVAVLGSANTYVSKDGIAMGYIDAGVGDDGDRKGARPHDRSNEAPVRSGLIVVIHAEAGVRVEGQRNKMR